MYTKPLLKAIIAGAISGVILYGMMAPLVTNADAQAQTKSVRESTTLVYNGRLTICKLDRNAYEAVRTIKNAVVTGYSSTIGQTDPTPFTPADGTDLRDLKEGEYAIATNILPLGTIVRLTVEKKVVIAKVRDRMNAKYNDQKRFDLYFSGDGEIARKEALKWGVKVLDIEILES